MKRLFSQHVRDGQVNFSIQEEAVELHFDSKGFSGPLDEEAANLAAMVPGFTVVDLPPIAEDDDSWIDPHMVTFRVETLEEIDAAIGALEARRRQLAPPVDPDVHLSFSGDSAPLDAAITAVTAVTPPVAEAPSVSSEGIVAPATEAESIPDDTSVSDMVAASDAPAEPESPVNAESPAKPETPKGKSKKHDSAPSAG